MACQNASGLVYAGIHNDCKYQIDKRTIMRRSEINSIINSAKSFFAAHHFLLPEWASWPPGAWKGSYERCSEIIDNKLGWDITDFGSGEFAGRGLVLFTIRNGSLIKKDKMYCEKIMVAGEGQETPLHFHWNKTEDIINRGGGNLVLEIFGKKNESNLSDEPVMVSVDGISVNVKAGAQLVLKPGSSICLKPGVYHRFYAQEGGGRVLIGEVSMVNDDEKDNRFYEQIGRFPEITEDEYPVHLLINDYPKYL
jgi:D-lyxose ketol-isomerase